MMKDDIVTTGNRISNPTMPGAKRTCETVGCMKQPTFGLEGEKASCCKEHKLAGMKDVHNKRCIHPGCIKQPTFGAEGEKALYCAEHKLEGMIDVKSKRCLHIGCKKGPTFGLEGEKATYCKDHRLDGMINVKCRHCAHTGCKKQANYGIEWGKATHCSGHSQEGMENVKTKRCQFPSCKKIPHYGLEWRIATHCGTHRQDGMKDVKNKRCEYPSCEKIPNYGLSEGDATHCAEHKSSMMINVKSKNCQYHGCCKQPSYGLEWNKPTHCIDHKQSSMTNVRAKRCKGEYCDTIASNKQYEGYCLRCFVHLFPDKPNARNYKTKERAVVEFLQTTFPRFTLICDKRVADGCSKRRPDVLIDFGEQVLCVEVDENMHTTYDCSCENKRLMEISQDIGHRNLVFLRFNPDSYINENGVKVRSAWGTDGRGLCVVKQVDDWMHRLSILKEQVEYWAEHRTEKTLEVIPLFYDTVLDDGSELEENTDDEEGDAEGAEEEDDGTARGGAGV